MSTGAGKVPLGWSPNVHAQGVAGLNPVISEKLYNAVLRRRFFTLSARLNELSNGSLRRASERVPIEGPHSSFKARPNHSAYGAGFRRPWALWFGVAQDGKEHPVSRAIA